MNRSTGIDETRRAARRVGIAPTYVDAAGVRRAVADETLAALVDLLGKDAPAPDGPAIVVAWDGLLPPIAPHRSQRTFGHAGVGASCELRGEDGADLGRLTAGADGTLARAGAHLPFGVHELVAAGRRIAFVISAPARADRRRSGEPERPWGVFAPVYALRDARRRPAGDLTSLEQLGAVAASLGASAVATLPLLAELATADGGAPGQRPYSPLSRLFWNEAYLDLARVPELASGPEPRRLLEDADRAAQSPGSDRADLASLATRSRPALDEALRRLRRSGGERLRAFERYVGDRPELERYARFRAATELAGSEFARWPASWRSGHVGADEVPESVVGRHCFAQWAMDVQLESAHAALDRAGVGLLMDLPIGCAPSGYDPWAFPGAFVAGASIGAPPDGFFGAGQRWGFPPPHPSSDRRDGYPVLRACLAHSLRHAAALRVDHILGWSRLWWIPDGSPADQGAYVRYPLEELLAVSSLEAWRHSARLVGEDLGTVEPGLRANLRRHGIAGMHVAVFDLANAPERRLRPGRNTVAYVGTHDTATFAGWLDGSDIELRIRLGLVGAAAATTERERRAAARATLVGRLRRSRMLAKGASGAAGAEDLDDPDAQALELYSAVLAELGASDASLVLAAVEDLWAERDPQNVPGTTDEHENFSRRFACTLELLAGDERARAIVGRLDTARRSELRRPR